MRSVRGNTFLPVHIGTFVGVTENGLKRANTIAAEADPLEKLRVALKAAQAAGAGVNTVANMVGAEFNYIIEAVQGTDNDPEEDSTPTDVDVSEYDTPTEEGPKEGVPYDTLTDPTKSEFAGTDADNATEELIRVSDDEETGTLNPEV